MDPRCARMCSLIFGGSICVLGWIAGANSVYTSVGYTFGCLSVYGSWALQVFFARRAYGETAENLHAVMDRNRAELQTMLREQEAIGKVLTDPRVKAAHAALCEVARMVALEHGAPTAHLE